MSQFSPLHITFAIYILAMVGIGFAAWYYTRSFDDYILGGRSLGSFVTAAINEVDIEDAFGLTGIVDGPLAVCGFGARAETMQTYELDPHQKAWPRKAGVAV